MMRFHARSEAGPRAAEAQRKKRREEGRAAVMNNEMPVSVNTEAGISLLCYTIFTLF